MKTASEAELALKLDLKVSEFHSVLFYDETVRYFFSATYQWIGHVVSDKTGRVHLGTPGIWFLKSTRTPWVLICSFIRLAVDYRLVLKNTAFRFDGLGSATNGRPAIRKQKRKRKGRGEAEGRFGLTCCFHIFFWTNLQACFVSNLQGSRQKKKKDTNSWEIVTETLELAIEANKLLESIELKVRASQSWSHRESCPPLLEIVCSLVLRFYSLFQQIINHRLIFWNIFWSFLVFVFYGYLKMLSKKSSRPCTDSEGVGPVGLPVAHVIWMCKKLHFGSVRLYLTVIVVSLHVMQITRTLLLI